MINLASATQATMAANASRPESVISSDATRDMFLRLLVEQIRNQDPLNPLDPTQFISQLSQFSEMEQLLQVRQTLEGIHDLLQSRSNQESNAGTKAK